MKLSDIFEVTIPMDMDSPYDTMQARDNEDSMSSPKDERHEDREKKPRPSRRNSNFNKAKRIRNMVSMMKRDRAKVDEPINHAVDNGETPDQSKDNPHGSSFLNR